MASHSHLSSFISTSNPHSRIAGISHKDGMPSHSDAAPRRFRAPSSASPVALKHRPCLELGTALASAKDPLPLDDSHHEPVKRTNVWKATGTHNPPEESWLFAPMDEKMKPACVTLLPSESPSASKFRRLVPIPYVMRRLYPTGLVRRIDDIKHYPTTWLVLYFALNLSLTLYNKSVLLKFPFPYTLTAVHALCGAIGTGIWLRWGSRTTSSHPLTSAPSLHHHQQQRRPPLPPLQLGGGAGLPSLSCGQIIVLILFSFLYTINIVVSNASLRLVTVPFHQVVRASTPFFTVIFSAALLRKPCSRKKMLSLVPVVAGVGFATYGDYYFTAFGFMLTLLGTVLAAMKTTITNIILIKPPPPPQSASLPLSHPSIEYPDPNQNPHFRHSSRMLAEPATPPQNTLTEFLTSLPTILNNVFLPSPYPSPKRSPAMLPNDISPQNNSNNNDGDVSSTTTSTSGPGFFTLPKLSLSPLHLLFLLSPLAFVQTMVLAQLTGELDRVRLFLMESAQAGTLSSQRSWLLLNGILAFFLNVVSFNANRRLGPLAMTVAANVKQVLTILCAVVMFNLTITPANGVGIVLTLMGGAIYATVELKEKKEIRRRRMV